MQIWGPTQILSDVFQSWVKKKYNTFYMYKLIVFKVSSFGDLPQLL